MYGYKAYNFIKSLAANMWGKQQNSVCNNRIGSLDKFTEVYLSKLADSNQIFRNDFVCIYYYLCKISAQIIE